MSATLHPTPLQSPIFPNLALCRLSSWDKFFHGLQGGKIQGAPGTV